MNQIVTALMMVRDGMQELNSVPLSWIAELPEYAVSQVVCEARAVIARFDRPQTCEEGTQPLQAAE